MNDKISDYIKTILSTSKNQTLDKESLMAACALKQRIDIDILTLDQLQKHKITARIIDSMKDTINVDNFTFGVVDDE